MFKTVLTTIAVFALPGAASAQDFDSRQLTTTIRDGLDWLVAQQATDGAWRSQTYGALREGPALTSLALYAAAHLNKDHRNSSVDAWRLAFAFLQTGIRKHRRVAAPDGTVDYPNYSAAMLLVAAKQVSGLAEPEVQSLIDYLLAAQLAERRGFQPDDPDYGGWDLLGPDARGITNGGNVSVSAFVAEALRLYESPNTKAALTKLEPWARRCQNLPGDGGFAFTNRKTSIDNKAGWRDPNFANPRSYGTATCDGIRILIACGRQFDSQPLERGFAWLDDHPQIQTVPGFDDPPAELGWQQGLRFYYYAALSAVLSRQATVDLPRTQAIAEHIRGLQREDGSWRNASARMREDDPLVATSLALIALGQCETVLSKAAAATSGGQRGSERELD